MRDVSKLRLLFLQKNFWNVILIVIFFPIYLYGIQSSQSIISIFGLGGLIILGVYLFFIYSNHIRSYQIPIHYIISSILFMRVIKGDTVPIALIVIVLGIGLFVIQDIISHKEYQKSEMMRQIILSGVIFMSFSTYAFLFGSVFISSISPFMLSLIALISTFNIALYTLWIYHVHNDVSTMSAVIISIGIVQLFIGLRALPLTHLTQAIILTALLIFSLSVFRDAYLQVLTRKIFVGRFILLLLMITILVFTSLI